MNIYFSTYIYYIYILYNTCSTDITYMFYLSMTGTYKRKITFKVTSMCDFIKDSTYIHMH